MSLLGRYGSHTSSLSLYRQPAQSARPSSMRRFFQSTHKSVLPPLPDGKGGTAPNSSRDEKKKAENEPICDLEIVPGGAKGKIDHSKDVKLPDLPPLPPITSSSFTKSLVNKIKLLETTLNWLNSEADVDAKEIRLDTLKELKELDQSWTSMHPDDFDLIWKFINGQIFREVQVPEKKFLFSDDLVVFNEPSLAHLTIVYELLSEFVLKMPKQFNTEFVTKIIGRFVVPDANERTILADLVIKVFNEIPEHNILIVGKCKMNLLDYLDGNTLPYVLQPSLAVLLNMFNKNTKNLEVPEIQDIYYNYVLPVLGALHYQSCAPTMFSIIELFVKNSQPSVIPTMKALFTHFPRTRSSKTISFLQALTLTLTKITVKDFKHNMKKIFHLYIKCATCPQIKVSSASFGIWTKIELEPMIMDNAKIIFPMIYPTLSKASRESWSSDIKSTVDDIMQVMNRIDGFIFQELCRQKAPPPSNQNDSIKTWAMIARDAAKRDKDINLAVKLAEIQRIFASSHLQAYSQSQPRSNKSSVALSQPTPVSNSTFQKYGNRSNVAIKTPIVQPR